MMQVGIPKEVKDNEYRVGMTPSGVSSLVGRGHRVWVESGAGSGSGFSDDDYRKAGASVTGSRKKLFASAQLITKVKEPQPEEYAFFSPDQILMTYLHLAANRKLTEFLMERRVAALAYETIEDANGTRPILQPMSEVAGRMSVQIGAHFLQRSEGGSGVLLAGLPGVLPGQVAILGGGTVGKNAARIALALGARVSLVEEKPGRRSELDDLFQGRLITLPAYAGEIGRLVCDSDLVIGAAARGGHRAPHLVTRQMISSMRPGSVVVDVSIDQGGCFETSRPTSHSRPTYVTGGVIHYCVPNIPGIVPRTSTLGLTSVTLPFIMKVADLGLAEALKTDKGLARGVNVFQGSVTCADVAEVFGLPRKTFFFG